MNALLTVDWVLRGAAGGLLAFHGVHVLGSNLPRPHAWALAAFVGSVMAYLLCSHPEFGELPGAVRAISIACCLMTAPLFWLSTQVVFRDGFEWTTGHSLGFGLTLGLGACAATGVGGEPVVWGHKCLLIGFAVAALWSVAQDWLTDLVSTRRTARTWFLALLGVHVTLVLVVELIHVGSRVPRGLEVLNIGAIAALALVLAVKLAKYPIHDWLEVRTTVQPPDKPNLTPTPTAVDRKSDLIERLLHAMGTERAYAQESLSLAGLAKTLNVAVPALREAINQHLGYRNFNDFLHHYRVDEAAQRLLCQDLPVLTIALDVGYGSIGVFNRAFKQINGVTPSEFRAKTPKT